MVAETDEVWVLGGTGRFGRGIARVLTEQGVATVLVGRDAARLARVGAEVGAARIVVAADVETMAAAIRQQRPAVVVNTVGPFARTARPLAEACLPASSYVDLANDVEAAEAVLDLQGRAAAAGRTLVTGAAFGVVGTEAPISALCAERSTPISVRVDSVASLTLEAGPFGEALAATVIESVPAGGRRVHRGRLVRTRLGSFREQLELPDGSVVTTGSWPSGDLVAARRISRAPDIVAATTEVPTGTLVRAVLPLAGLMLRIPALRRLATRRLAAVQLKDTPMPRPHTWGHARAQWADGTVRHAWMRTGDTTVFTTAIPAHAALRILNGHGRPGAGTPLESVGGDLLADAGGEILLT